MKSSSFISDRRKSNADESAADTLLGEFPAPPELHGENPGGEIPSSPFTSRLGDAAARQNWLPSSSTPSRTKLKRSALGRIISGCLLIALGLIGALLIATVRTTRITATADALLPYSSQAAPAGAPLVPNVVVTRLNPRLASSSTYEFQSTAPDAAAAISEVDTSAQNAVHLNTTAWAGAAASNNSTLAAMPLARVIVSGDENPLRRRTLYHLNYHRLPFALLWLAACCAAALTLVAARPKSKQRLQFAFRSPGSRNGLTPDAPQINDLPHMARVHLARDIKIVPNPADSHFSEYAPTLPGSDLRPVLSGASEKLWVNFASRADLASAAAISHAAYDDSLDASTGTQSTQLTLYSASAQAVLQQAEAVLALNSNTEILFTRLTHDARGSRAAMLAIARLLAQRGKRIVLIDLDFAAPPEAQAELGLPGEFPGAAEILSRRAHIDDCLLTDDDYPALTAIASSLEGTEISHEQAARLLQSAEMLDLLDELREGNHLVLIHGPAAEEAARSLGSRADAALLVVSQEPTEREHQALPDALAEMSAVQANIVGRIEFHGEIA